MANERLRRRLKRGVDGWNAWRDKNPHVKIDLSFADFCKANLRGALLNGADFGGAILSGANLRGSGLIGACFREADLNQAFLFGAVLSGADLLEADLSGADLRGADLSWADLRGADLRGADLQDASLWGARLQGAYFIGACLQKAILIDTLALHTDFTGATLTGACIQDWLIGSSTIFNSVKCGYIFRSSVEGCFSGRLPVNSDIFFAPGEFEKWIQVRKGALDTIDITFAEGVDWQAFFQSLQVVRQQHPDANVVMKSVEEEGGVFVTRLRVETEVTGDVLDQLKGDIEKQIGASYDRQLAAAREENLLLRGENRALDKLVEIFAMTSKNTNYTFNAPVGNASGTNYGTMTAYINDNGKAIAQLIENLKISVQAFPHEQKDEVLMELDDLERDLKEPEKQEPKRIGKRLQRLIAAGATAATIAGGAADFADDLNKFTESVYELGEKVGLTREYITGG